MCWTNEVSVHMKQKLSNIGVLLANFSINTLLFANLQDICMGPRANLFKSQKKTQKEVEISLYVFLASLKLRSVVFMGRKLGRQFLCIQTKTFFLS